MFMGCLYALKEAPELPATTLINNCYYHMFADCSSLTSVNLSNITPKAPYSLYEMFFQCPKLTYIDISSFQSSDDPEIFDDSLPPKGTIVIKSDFLKLIREIIPQN